MRACTVWDLCFSPVASCGLSAMAAFVVGGGSMVAGSSVHSQRCSSFVYGGKTIRGKENIVRDVGLSSQNARWSMMAKVSKFGPFTPVVVAARLVIGEKSFNRIRGKGIALHSQVRR